MSEARDLLDRFQNGYTAEYLKAHKHPTVCVMGHHDFAAIEGTIAAMIAYGPNKCLAENCQAADARTVIKARVNRTIMWQGVRIFCSYANETGMVFGGPERE